jgi:hypothetical protein
MLNKPWLEEARPPNGQSNYYYFWKYKNNFLKTISPKAFRMTFVFRELALLLWRI